MRDGQDECIDWLEKQAEQKPWSEEDEEIYRKCICAMRASACGFPEEEKFVEQVDNWLKSLKDRVQPQPKQEWSEEDEVLLKLSLENLTELKDRFGEDYGRVGDCINWLKYLKDRYTWKPSEEYIDLINEAIGFFGAHSAKGMLMMDLRNNINKLREE